MSYPILFGNTASAGAVTGLGLSSSSPAISGVQVRDSGATQSGWYWIKTSGMATARQVYVNLADEGGGWMLASFKPSTATLGIGYPGVWSNGEGTLNHLTVRVEDLWYHNGSAQCNSVLKMGASSAQSTPLLSSYVIANKVVYSNPSVLNLWEGGPTGSPVFTSSTSLNGTWSPVKGHTQMTSPLSVIAPADWLYNEGSSYYWTPCGPSTDTSNVRSGNGNGTGSWMNATSDTFYGLSDVSTTASSNSFTPQSIAVYIR